MSSAFVIYQRLFKKKSFGFRHSGCIMHFILLCAFSSSATKVGEMSCWQSCTGHSYVAFLQCASACADAELSSESESDRVLNIGGNRREGEGKQFKHSSQFASRTSYLYGRHGLTMWLLSILDVLVCTRPILLSHISSFQCATLRLVCVWPHISSLYCKVSKHIPKCCCGCVCVVVSVCILGKLSFTF